MKLIKSTFFNEQKTQEKLADFIRTTSQLSIGERCKKFEKQFAKWQGRSHCTLFNSGSSANLALIQALSNLGRLRENDQVGFSGLTWSTNVMPLFQHNLKPIPIDVELETLNVSPRTLRQAHRQTPLKALFLTNALGFSDAIEEIKKLCDEQNILLLEDNCESLGSEYKKGKLGNFGEAATFSFYVGHHLSTIEGGAVCTDDQELDAMLRMVRSHGWDRHLDNDAQRALRKKHDIDDFYGKYAFYDLAFNLRPTEIQGFLGSEQLPYLNDMIEKRAKNFAKLSTIYKNEDFTSIKPNMTLNSNFALPIIAREKDLRRVYLEKCESAGIENRPIIGGMMTNQPFFKKYNSDRHHLPNTQTIHNNGFYIGNNPELTKEEIDLVIKTLSAR